MSVRWCASARKECTKHALLCCIQLTPFTVYHIPTCNLAVSFDVQVLSVEKIRNATLCNAIRLYEAETVDEKNRKGIVSVMNVERDGENLARLSKIRTLAHSKARLKENHTSVPFTQTS